MPSLSNVRRTGRCDCSTIRMISSFSDAGYLMRHREAMLRIDVSPIPGDAFFEQAQLEGLLGDDLFQLLSLALEVFDLAAGRRPCRVRRPDAACRLRGILSTSCSRGSRRY